MIFARVVQIAVVATGFTCITTADKLQSFSLRFSVFLSVQLRFSFLGGGLVLVRMRGNLLIFPKMSISRLLWGDRWKLHGEIQRHATLCCLTVFKWSLKEELLNIQHLHTPCSPEHCGHFSGTLSIHFLLRPLSGSFLINVIVTSWLSKWLEYLQPMLVKSLLTSSNRLTKSVSANALALCNCISLNFFIWASTTIWGRPCYCVIAPKHWP